MNRLQFWLAVSQWVVALIMAVAIWAIRGAFRVGELMTKIDQFEKRLDLASAKMSELASEVQKFPQTLRSLFLPIDVATEMVRESREDRKELHEAIKDLQRQTGRKA